MTPAVRESRPSLMCCRFARCLGGGCPACVRPSLPPPPPRGAPVVARVACAACATLARELGRDVGCLRHPRETATPDTSGAQSVVDGLMGEGSEGR